MGVLNDFLGRSDQGKAGFDPNGEGFVELDLDKLKRDLNLVDEGRKRGEKNLPPTESQTFDDIEHKIVTIIENEQRKQLQAFGGQQSLSQQRIASLDLENESLNIGEAAQRSSSEFIVKVDDGKARLFTLWRNVCMIESEWNDFRREHHLSHPADYPLSRLWNFAIILVILTIESVLNGNFLARGLETGLIGGVVEAFVIAAINISFGVFLGHFVVRYLFHRSWAMKILALIEVPISIGIDVCFNLAVGHYRDALGGNDPMHASAVALTSFAAHPLQLASLESWILFAVGSVFFIIATCDGFKMDDPYPGYGKISRKHEEITQDYMNEKGNIIEDLTHTRDEALDSIREARKNLAARRSELATTLDQREKMAHVLDAQRSYLDRAANDLLSTYRSANMGTRSTPAPQHFNKGFSLPAPSSASPLNAVNIAALDANIEKTDAALKDALQQVNSRFEEAIGSFHQIGEFTKGKDVAATSAA